MWRTISVILMISSSVFTFRIIEVDPGSVTVAPGERVTLWVKTDGHYEWCKYFSPDPRGGMYCDFEWKYNQGNITTQACPLSDRVKFHGKYDDKQCGITFTAGEEDNGEWRVEIEEYVTLGKRGSGHVEKATFKVNIAASTPEPTVSTITTPPTKIPTLTFMNPKTTTTTTPITKTKKNSTPMITTQSTTPITTGTKTTVTENESTITTSTTTKSTISTDPTSSAIPLSDDPKSSSSSGVVVGVIIVLLVVIVTISGVFYYRRRRNSSVVSVAYDQAVMVEAGTPGVTITTTGRETSNLHEYYPPNLNGYTVNSTS